MNLAPEETVYRHGDPAGPLYLIDAGRVRVMRHDAGRPRHVATLGAGESFGVVSAKVVWLPLTVIWVDWTIVIR